MSCSVRKVIKAMNRLLQYGVGVGVDVRLSVSLLVGACLLAWFGLVWFGGWCR